MKWVRVCAALPVDVARELDELAERMGMVKKSEAVRLALKVGLDALARGVKAVEAEDVRMARRRALLNKALGLVRGMASTGPCAERERVLRELEGMGYTRAEAEDALDKLHASGLIYKPFKDRDCYRAV